jgi:hypothetical protein
MHEEQPINFSAILPAPILPAYQSQITGITAVIHQATPGKRFRLELKNSGSYACYGYGRCRFCLELRHVVEQPVLSFLPGQPASRI